MVKKIRLTSADTPMPMSHCVFPFGSFIPIKGDHHQFRAQFQTDILNSTKYRGSRCDIRQPSQASDTWQLEAHHSGSIIITRERPLWINEYHPRKMGFSINSTTL